jgi:hypothetical protein
MSRDPIEIGQGRHRLTDNRLSDMETPRPTPERPSTLSEQASQNAKWRGAREAISAPLKAVAGEEVRRALGSDATPAESQLVARNALVIAGDVQRDVGIFSPFIAHHVTRFGVNSALAGYLTQRSADAGFDSDRGLALLEAAHRCEQQATRAMVAIDAAVRTSARKRDGQDDNKPPPWLVPAQPVKEEP